MQNNIESNFIPYEQALELKELGFDEPCLGYFSESQQLYLCRFENMSDRGFVSAPTYSQAFRWFREKYSLVHEISWSKYKGGLNFDYDVFSLVLPTDDELGDEDDIASDKSMETYDSLVDKDFRHPESNTYEGAEQACLDKLIEICKK